MLSSLASQPKKSLYLITLGIVLFVIARLSFGGFNFSHFIVAGSDFVDQEKVSAHTIVQEGQGYDGQFFYRYSLNPFNQEKKAYGITVDHIEYRMQRIVYPFTVWLFSIGGKEEIVPFLMVFCNVLALFGIFYFTLQIAKLNNIDLRYALLPIFIFGAYMSLARNTSEIFEILFFITAIYAMFVQNIFLYVIGIFLAIFSRETSLIAIAPLTLVYGIHLLKKSNFKLISFLKLSSLAIPFIGIVLWKYYLHVTIQSENLVDGSQNLSFPFHGIYLGIINSINFSDTKHTLETAFWFLYFIWNVWFITTVIQRINFRSLIQLDIPSILSIVYLVWSIFALFLGFAIYTDDWGFVRIFALWNMLGFLIVMLTNQPLKKSFLGFSILLLVLTVVRLIIRV